MSTAQVSRAQYPQWVRVSLPVVSIPDCPEAASLLGDYILMSDAVRRSPAEWRVRFEPVCGFRAMSAMAEAGDDGTFHVQLRMVGGVEQPMWEAAGVADLESEQTLVLREGEKLEGAWPEEVTWTPIVSSPEAGMQMSALQSAESSSDLNICGCSSLFAGIVAEELNITTWGVEDLECNLCSEFNGTQEAIPESYSTTCRWETEGLTACNGLGPVPIFFSVEFICGDENDPCGVRLWAELSELDMLWETIIPFEDFDPLATSYTLPVKEAPDIWYYCNWENSWLTIDVTLIDPLPFTVFKHCFNIQPCKYSPISLPPVDERNCLQITLCCGCPCCCGESNVIPAPAIPSPGECSSCSTDTCSYVVNVISGSVGLGLGIPKSDPMVPAVAVTIISGPLVYRSDLRTQRIEEIDECNVYVHRCDGSRQLYYCKDDEGWYTPLGNITNNSLQEQEAGGWVETAPSGQTFHYESTGPLFNADFRRRNSPHIL